MYSDGGLAQFLILGLALGLVLKPQDLPRAAHFFGRVCGRTVSFARELRQGATQLTRLAEEESGPSASSKQSDSMQSAQTNPFQLHKELQESLAELRHLRILLRREWDTALASGRNESPLVITRTYQPAVSLRTPSGKTGLHSAHQNGADIVLRALEEQAFVSEVERTLGPRESSDISNRPETKR
ncbi:hypothetical protein CCYA_CCYA10G2964 [Cyanidiococcus yangmingshanensis]|nr:hypothetical protein CCYA_CCYA10G2964 [Cyanidiococcus yangmingshanensis]